MDPRNAVVKNDHEHAIAKHIIVKNMIVAVQNFSNL